MIREDSSSPTTLLQLSAFYDNLGKLLGVCGFREGRGGFSATFSNCFLVFLLIS